MFGIGAQEVVILGVLFLLIFGPGKLPEVARDLGHFVNQARGYVDEFKSDLTSIEKEKEK